MLLVGSAYRIAVDATRPFSKLFAAGLATILGVPDVHHPRRRHARDPAHRHHAAVRLVRRLVARRELRRSSPCCCASPTRPREATRDAAAARPERSPREPHASAASASAMLVLFLGLVAQLDATSRSCAPTTSKNDPRNVRVFLRDVTRPRGPIITADGDDPRPVGADRRRPRADQRVYPPETAQLFAHVVGYQSVNFGTTGVEAKYNDAARRPRLRHRHRQPQRLLQRQGHARQRRAHACRAEAQQAAADALGGRRGSVVVLDVRDRRRSSRCTRTRRSTRNLLASHDTAGRAARTSRARTRTRPSPLLARAWREHLPARFDVQGRDDRHRLERCDSPSAGRRTD